MAIFHTSTPRTDTQAHKSVWVCVPCSQQAAKWRSVGVNEHVVVTGVLIPSADLHHCLPAAIATPSRPSSRNMCGDITLFMLPSKSCHQQGQEQQQQRRQQQDW